jgi:SpoVK/Ycf46/Vps4 family AAA+-type ATPase
MEGIERSELFELELELPERDLQDKSQRLIGFEPRYERLRQDLRMLLDPASVEAWSRKFYGATLPLVLAIKDRYPLVIFHGDVGTGKTATAETASNRLVKELGKEGTLFKLSTRVRGSGNVGQMSTLINLAFAVVSKEAGKSRFCFLIVDEADSLAATRENSQSHHEDKVAVNTLIQKIDDIRRLGGRILVFLCTNRFDALDPAIIRRAGRIEEFARPTAQEREALLRMDLEGTGLDDNALRLLVEVTGADGAKRPLGYTFSDLRTRLLPDALGRAYPTRKLEARDFLEVAKSMQASPSLTQPIKES